MLAMQQWFPLISLIWSMLSGPVIFLAVSAIHEQKTTKLIKTALAEERERAKDLFALKHEMSEMKGYVMQLVTTLPRFEEKLDEIAKAQAQTTRR